MNKALRRGGVATLIVGLAIVAMLVGPLSRPAVAGPVEEALLLTLTNTVRATVGAAPLTEDASLSAVARTWSDSMAAVGTISHNPNLSSQIFGWSRLAENVGMGPSTAVVHEALVASPTHYANMTNPVYTHVGLAVVSSGLTVFITEVFIQKVGSAAPAPPATVAPPATPPPTVGAAATVPRRVATPVAPKTPSPATTPTVATLTGANAGPVIPQTVAIKLTLRPPSPWVEHVFQQLRVLDPLVTPRR